MPPCNKLSITAAQNVVTACLKHESSRTFSLSSLELCSLARTELCFFKYSEWFSQIKDPKKIANILPNARRIEGILKKHLDNINRDFLHS